MGKLTPTADVDSADVAEEGTLNAAGVGDWVALRGEANLVLSGNFVGEVILEASFDGGQTAHPCTANGSVVVFTAPAHELIFQPERGVLIRVRLRARTSGTLTWRLSR